MRCTSPRTVGFKSDGRTLSWSPRTHDQQYATFDLPCGKCIECRLEYARDTAVRCVHEAKMHEHNSFITLTYSDEHLKSPRLQYIDFQLFLKKLRDKIFRDHLEKFGKYNWSLLTKEQKKEEYKKIAIPFMVTGEYGEINKRPHWHALIFNWSPTDIRPKYTSDNGDEVYSSHTLDTLWGHGITELGSVTFQSAGYCARYSAKKLIHGFDQQHNFHPVHKRSSKYAIGKTFLEKHYKHIFTHGFTTVRNKDQIIKTSIPRYYEKWFKAKHPERWVTYVTNQKLKRQEKAQIEKEKLDHETNLTNDLRKAHGNYEHQISTNKVKRIIAEEKFKRLQQYLKGDI